MPKIYRRHIMSAENQKIETESKQAIWRQHHEYCLRSGLAQKEYCRAHGLALSTFCYWKKKLKVGGTKTPRFYPLTVQHVSPQNDLPAKSGLTLTLGTGKYHIEFAEDFSAPCLKKLILTLEEL